MFLDQDGKETAEELEQEELETSENPEEESGGSEEKETGEKEEKAFMNPNELPEELKPAFKKMQASFTRAMQKLAGERQKVELAEKILDNPDKAIELIAEATGKNIPSSSFESEPTDDETVAYVKNLAMEAIKPLVNQLGSEVAQLKVQLVQTYLDNQYPDWYLYENEMADLLKAHPSLGNDLDKLYLLAKSAHEEANLTKARSQKKPTSSTKPSSGRHETEEIKSAKNLDEAFDIALKRLGYKS